MPLQMITKNHQMLTFRLQQQLLAAKESRMTMKGAAKKCPYKP